MTTHILLLCIHSNVCKLLVDDDIDVTKVKAAFEAMKAFSVNAVKMCGFNELKKSREVTKLLLMEYYLDLMGKSKTKEELLASFLVKYIWEEERKIFKVGFMAIFGYKS